MQSSTASVHGYCLQVICAVLEHANLIVQTEEQVLVFVLNYVQRHELEHTAIATLFAQVKLPYLSNERLGKLIAENTVPKDLLLAGMASRLQMIDHPERMQSVAGNACQPRKTYCCTVEYGLPGGSEYASLPLEAVWEDLLAWLEVGVSGESGTAVGDCRCKHVCSGQGRSCEEAVRTCLLHVLHHPLS